MLHTIIPYLTCSVDIIDSGLINSNSGVLYYRQQAAFFSDIIFIKTMSIQYYVAPKKL